jgi:hypothetical protein
MSSINIETLLYEEIKHDFDKIIDLEPGTEQHRMAADIALKMVDRAIEMNKIGNDSEARDRAFESELKVKQQQFESEQLIKQQQLDDEKKDRMVKNTLTLLGIALPLIATAWGVHRTLEFEKEGTVTTIMGRGLIQKLLPKR